MEYNLGPAEGTIIFNRLSIPASVLFCTFKNRKGVEAFATNSATSVIHGVPSLNKKEDYSLV